MTTKDKAGLAVLLLTVFVRVPISFAGTILLYKHVNAPEIVWVLLWVSVPIIILVEISSDLLKAGLFGDAEK